ncbi:unnamed protein product [Closterium sp. NIES-64]|nr:unnamed protein product [Closterium sp. NIES-64]
MSGGARGAAAEGEATGALGAGGSISVGARGVGVEPPLVEDTAASCRQPRPASPPGFPSDPQYHLCSPPRPVAAKSGVFLLEVLEAVGVFLVEILVLELEALPPRRLHRTLSVSSYQQQQQQQSQSESQDRVEEESRLPQQVQLEPQQERVEQESRPEQQVHLRPQQERVEQESRPQEQVLLQPQQERAEEEPRE